MYRVWLTGLRDALKAGLSGREPKAGEPTVAELAERIKGMRAGNQVETAPERTARKVTGEEPMTSRIQKRAESEGESWRGRVAGEGRRQGGEDNGYRMSSGGEEVGGVASFWQRDYLPPLWHVVGPCWNGGNLMSRGLLLVGLVCAGLSASVAVAVCPPCGAKTQTVTVVYHVADLVLPIDRRPVTVQIGPDTKAVRHPPKQEEQTTEARLIERITREIAPETWGNVGAGKIDYRVAGLSLIVTHTPAVQEKVASLLAALRREQDLSVSLELRVLRVSDRVAGQLGLVSGEKEGGVLDEAGLRKVMEVAQADQLTSVLQAPKVTCFDGQRVNFCISEEEVDFTLHVAQAVSKDRCHVRLSLRLCRTAAEEVKVKEKVAGGSSVVLPGWSALRQTRQEFGPPVLSEIPYLNRLFMNVGYTREAERVFLIVTPRVIVDQDATE